MSPSLFVTGTDTGCGKTRVAIALIRALRSGGRSVAALKPVETGCTLVDGVAQPTDALALGQAAGHCGPAAHVCPYPLKLAASPEVAARVEGVQIEVERIAQALKRAQRSSDFVVVEGAGGLLVPLSPRLDMAGLAAALGLPLLVVARAALGTVNHTLLTLEAAERRGLRVLGVVVSHSHPDLPHAERQNLDSLIQRLPVPFLGELKFGAEELFPALDPSTILADLGGS